MVFALTRDDTDLSAAVAIEDLSTERLFKKLPLAWEQHFGGRNDGTDPDIVDLLLPQIAGKLDSSLRVGHHRDRFCPAHFAREFRPVCIANSRSIQRHRAIEQFVAKMVPPRFRLPLIQPRTPQAGLPIPGTHSGPQVVP